MALGCLGEYRSMVALGTVTGIRVFSGQLYSLQHVEGIDLVLRIPGSGQQFHHAQADLLPGRIVDAGK